MSVRKRLDAVRQILADTGVDALLVTNPANRRYVTGFTAEDHAADESAGMVLVTRESTTLLVSPTNLPWARAEADADEIAIEPFERSMVSSVAQRLAARSTRQVAVEDATTPAALWFALEEALGETVELVRAGNSVDRIRAVKREDELDHLRQAARLTDAAFERAVSRFAPGMTEREGADLVREALRDVGSDGEAFDTIVAAGPNAAKPHHRPGDRPIEQGEPVIIDMGARVNGYNGDLTRTISLGEADGELTRIYEVVLEAQQAGLRAIRAGAPASEPDLATREVFLGHGLGDHVIHSAGHGLGLRVHEVPSLRHTSEDILEPGNVVTMEPGLYIAGWGGVRIEDVVIVTETGNENLTSSPKGIDTAHR
jgi:Xaa-Pro aminopeptidase